MKEENKYKIKFLKNIYDISWDYAKTQNDIQCRVFLQLFIVFLGIGFTILLGIIGGSLSLWFALPAIGFFTLAVLYINRISLLPDELEENFKEIMDRLKKLI